MERNILLPEGVKRMMQEPIICVEQGIRIIRFENKDVKYSLESVIEIIDRETK